MEMAIGALRCVKLELKDRLMWEPQPRTQLAMQLERVSGDMNTDKPRAAEGFTFEAGRTGASSKATRRGTPREQGGPNWEVLEAEEKGAVFSHLFLPSQ